MIKLDFAGYLGSDDFEEINCTKKVLTEKFQDVNLEKLIKMLKIVDGWYVFLKLKTFAMFKYQLVFCVVVLSFYQKI